MAQPKDDASRLGAKMLAVLEARRALCPPNEFMTLEQLVAEADAAVSLELGLAAAGKSFFKRHAIVAFKADPHAPVILSEQLEQVAGSPQLLEALLNKLCSPEALLWPVSELAKQLHPQVKKPFLAALERNLQEQSLPPSVGFVQDKKSVKLFLQRMPPPLDPVAEQAKKLLDLLREQRKFGGEAYPLRLTRLLELAKGQVALETLDLAANSSLFDAAVVRAAKKSHETPIAFKEDLRQLADSRLLLEYLLEALCTPTKRTWPLAKLVSNLAAQTPLLTKELRQAFEESILRRLEQRSLPEFAGWIQLNEQPHLYLQRLPYLLPPLKPVELAQEILKQLEQRRQAGGESYPPRLIELVDSLRPQTTPEAAWKAVRGKALKNRIVLALAKGIESPLAFTEDLDQLANSHCVLEATLAAEQLEPLHVATLEDLVKHLSPVLKKSFKQAVHEKLAAASLPAAVGVLWHRFSPMFLMANPEKADGSVGQVVRKDSIQPSLAVPQAKPGDVVGTAIPFSHAFEEAFATLDRQKGSNNFVSIVDLRQALPSFDRTTFDIGLRQLRLAGGYSLRAVEGWSQLSDEERAAGIPEEGSLLLFVTRNGP